MDSTVESFIREKELSDIIDVILKYIHDSFNTQEITMELTDKYHGEKWLCITWYTGLSGETAARRLNMIEDELYDAYEDKFLDNILLSVEFHQLKE